MLSKFESEMLKLKNDFKEKKLLHEKEMQESQ